MVIHFAGICVHSDIYDAATARLHRVRYLAQIRHRWTKLGCSSTVSGLSADHHFCHASPASSLRSGHSSAESRSGNEDPVEAVVFAATIQLESAQALVTDAASPCLLVRISHLICSSNHDGTGFGKDRNIGWAARVSTKRV